MLSLLPDLAPRDSHSLWYTSTRNPLSTPNLDPYTPNNQPHHHQQQQQQQQQDGATGANHRGARHLIEASPLARLRSDEQNLERRRQNVASFGSTWLKPLGVPKTLHQLREERREAEEHAEAMRREALAQELAEAEAAGVGVGGDVDAMLDDVQQGGEGGDDGVMDDVQLDGARDLDDDIPEAEDADFGAGSDDEEDEDEEDDDEQEEEDQEQRVARTQQQLMAQRMRQADDAFRESMARGRDDVNYYGVDDEVDDEDQAQMIEEDDLAGGGDMDMGMDANLDDDIPEAEDAGYEHTDSEADLSTSSGNDDDRAEMSFAAHASQSQPQPPQQLQSRYRHGLARSDATRNSITISDILSHDGSMLGSSPEVQRRNSGAARRLGRG
ncbi:Apc15p protein-domain-containing protein [Hypoxylon trugodes]|uniref:Apc15p protein-domain-containing protein n=1 Tax=Hypoxylon trugodes TaxID=326681 RepID=UPI002198ADD8|nr:Apc15p protein-domain-containing protein [Hypoxylon trugodes]KAI1388845.1 Apc15p protein-domain-containing protein [Hypoxylon trugodes]